MTQKDANANATEVHPLTEHIRNPTSPVLISPSARLDPQWYIRHASSDANLAMKPNIFHLLYFYFRPWPTNKRVFDTSIREMIPPASLPRLDTPETMVRSQQSQKNRKASRQANA